MLEQYWDKFVIYVNAYYAVQEAYDSARRNWEQPAPGLKEFCRDANPFLWDGQSSAEKSIYEGFCEAYERRFGDDPCLPDDGLVLARAWLGGLEGDRYGSALVSSLDEVADVRGWRDACESVSWQLAHRAVRLEFTPQDEPVAYEEAAASAAGSQQSSAAPNPTIEQEEELKVDEGPSEADIEAVISLLSKGDEAFARSLRERLAQGDDA